MHNWVDTYVAPLNTPPPLKNAKLVAHILATRHGARTPCFTWPTYHEEINWPVGEKYKDLSVKRRVPVVNGTPVDFSQNTDHGRLLDSGIEQHENLGKLYYNYLVNETHLLPSKFDPSQVYVRSSFVPRCVECACALLQGMYPPNEPSEKLTIVTGQPENEALVRFPDFDEFCKSKTKELLNTEIMKERYSQIPDLIKNDIFPDNKIDAFTAGDFIHVLKFNGCKLPEIVAGNDQLYREMMVNMAYYTTYFFLIAGRKCFGPIFKLIGERISDFEKDESKNKFTLLSGHDVSLAAILVGLGKIILDAPPPYASHLAIEIWDLDDEDGKKDKEDRRVVRIAMNGEIVDFEGKELLPLKEFKEKYIDPDIE